MTHKYFQTVAGVDDTSAGADDTNAGVATELKWELEEDLFVMLFHFQLISSGAQSGRSGTYVAFGVVFFYFGSVVGP